MGNKWRWGVIIDAGSSGSRLHVYRWKDAAHARKDASADELQRLPKIKTKWTKKIKPGVSAFGDKPAEIGAAHLRELVDYALEVVPADMVADTPIFLMATAGMRFLPQPQQTALLREMCTYLTASTPFSLPDCAQNIQVIPGETEGLYGWLAANYLLGGFDRPDEHLHGPNQDHHTYGFLDMGGASAQIAFAPNATEAAEHADALKLVRLRTLDGQPAEHRVFSATWLGFGVNKARESYVEALVEQNAKDGGSGSDSDSAIPDPCMPKGLRTTLEGAPVGDTNTATPLLLGTGDFTACLVGTRPLLAEDATCGESTQPCLIHDPVPSIDFKVNHFVGVSEYYHSTHGFFGEEGDLAYDFTTYQRRVHAFCDRPWTAIAADVADKAARKGQDQAHVDRKLQDAQQACFKASWVINVLHEGIGIPRVGLDKLPDDKSALPPNDPFRPVDTIDSVEVSWTLGRMLLYASGQVPPHGATSVAADDKDLFPVGYGSNTRDGSLPADFTYAGSTWTLPPSKAGGDSDDDDDGDGNGVRSNGLLLFLFLLLLGLAYAVLRSRERRMRLFARVGALGWRRTGLVLPWWSSSSSSWRRRRQQRGRFGGIPGSAVDGRRRRSLVNLAKRMLFGPSSSSSSGSGGGGPSSHDYERVLEEGGGERLSGGSGNGGGRRGSAFFELGEMGEGAAAAAADAADELSVAGVARPTSTPQFHSEVVFGGGDGAGGGGGGGTAIDRSGLAVRTESRERLGGTHLQMLNAGRRSRAASPTRLKSSPLSAAPLEEE